MQNANEQFNALSILDAGPQYGKACTTMQTKVCHLGMLNFIRLYVPLFINSILSCNVEEGNIHGLYSRREPNLL